MTAWELLKENVPWLGVVVGAIASYFIARERLAAKDTLLAAELSSLRESHAAAIENLKATQERHDQTIKDFRHEVDKEQRDLRAALALQSNASAQLLAEVAKMAGQLDGITRSLDDVRATLAHKKDRE